MSAWLCILAYAFQIYFDFSGYSDMAIGLGKILGFTFPENFHYPYIARSITDFWRRWHMSLSGWFRDYVYIPLGGNRKGMKRQLLNIFIVWTLTGIWHGAGINFLLWGMWFALFLILEKLFLGKILQKIPGFFGWLYTMFLVLLSWSFFSIEDGAVLANVWRSLFFRAPGGVFNREALYFWENYRLLFFLLAVCSLPVGKMRRKNMAAPLLHRAYPIGESKGTVLCRGGFLYGIGDFISGRIVSAFRSQYCGCQL